MKSNFLKNINKYISFICSMKICCRQLCTLVSEDLYNQDADKINETAISGTMFDKIVQKSNKSSN